MLPPSAAGSGPAPVAAPAGLGDYFRSRFTAGDETAIFEFAAQDKTALRSRWVVVVLEAWQRQGTQEARDTARKFIGHFLKSARPEERISLSRIIAADQGAFQDMAHLHHSLSFPLAEAAALAAQRLVWPAPMALEVYQHYLRAVTSYFRPQPDGQYPWLEVFDWLKACLENMRRL